MLAYFGERHVQTRDSFPVGTVVKTNSIGVLLSGLLLAGQGLAQSEVRSYSQKTLLKNWALSSCLARVYEDQNTRDDASAAAAAYLEFGRQPIEAYESLERLVEKYASRKYFGSIQSDFNTMKCIDLFHSRELDSLVRRLLRSK